MSERPKISLITITRDEEALIGECLKSAWFCDEKIIIDSFSTDKTVEIARGLGADVVQHEFTNYVKQKQMALDRATGDWVLLMDADEQATHDLGEEILRAVSSPAAADGYKIRRILYHLGHYYSHAIYPDTPVRLFRRERGHIGGRDPHDKVVVEGQDRAAGQADSAFQLSRYRRSRRDDQPVQLARCDGAGAERVHAIQDDRESGMAVFQFLYYPRRISRRRTRTVRGDDCGVLRFFKVREVV